MILEFGKWTFTLEVGIDFTTWAIPMSLIWENPFGNLHFQIGPLWVDFWWEKGIN